MTLKYLRRCIKIAAKDSPNVALALWQQEQGYLVTGQTVVPGVLGWDVYQSRLKKWTDEGNEQRICESLEGDWYEGQSLKLVPSQWLDLAHAYQTKRPAGTFTRYMGCDPGEGGDDTAVCVGDRHGILDMVSMKTPDTNKVIGLLMEMQHKWKVDWDNICIDEGSGGGGRVHIDRFWANGKKVRGVGFGAAPQLELRRGMTYFSEKRDQRADKYAFVKCRDEMAFDVRCILERDVDGNYVDKNSQAKVDGFAIPKNKSTEELCRQLALIPYGTDGEGRMKLPPKRDPKDPKNPETLVYIVGHSPDQFDAFCLMTYAMNHKPPQQHASVR
jgi:hypothetical protein